LVPIGLGATARWRTRKIREHAVRARLQVSDIFEVANTDPVRPDPAELAA